MRSSQALRSSARIAAALLDELRAQGEDDRVVRAVDVLTDAGGDPAALEADGVWLPETLVARMFEVVDADRALARRVGARLASAAALGLALRTGGLGTTEKAYRRCDELLARETPNALYEAGDIADRRAWIRFHPAPGGEPAPALLDCGLREGMLASFPALFGLPPARARERECTARGAPACVFELRWRDRERSGLLAGAAIGVGLGAVLGHALEPLWGLAAAIAAAAVVAGLAAGCGHAFDLSRQLAALRGLRHRATTWLDAVDLALDERMDELAKLDSAVDSAAGAGAAPGGDRPRERADLAELVERAVAGVRESLPSSVAIELDVESGAPSVLCHAHQIEQMLLELLRNAVGASSAGGRVGVSLRATLHGVEIAVSDEGEGIEPETVDEVFDPFFAPEAADGDRGFGLPVSYRIARAHGGELRVESESGRGTRVVVALPAGVLGAASTAH